MIKILVDTSFSMKELGKKDSIEMVLKSLIDELNLNNLEYKILDFEGRDIDFKNFLLNNKQLNFDLLDNNTILISDGLFEVKNLQKGISIAVGIDADFSNLENLTKKVFNIDEILKVMDYVLYHFDISENKSNLTEDEDEW
jgi:hypothetical protein